MSEDIRDAAYDAADAPITGGEGTPPEAAPVLPVDDSVLAGDEFAALAGEAERLRALESPDYRDRWLRAEAELQNSRRRAARDRDDAVRVSEDRILLELIEILDDVERALAALTPEQAADPWTQGVTLTAQRMRDALARRGVNSTTSVGLPFDPVFHEALLVVPAPEGIAPGAVAQEVQKGYRRGERALRVARVIVARADG
jgi:molecular chaperone GrpE